MRLLAVCVLLFSGLLAGCAESQKSQVSKARLIANENRKLVTQIEEKDKRIAELETELAKLKEDYRKEIEKLNANSSQLMGALMLKQQQLQAENTKLKQQSGSDNKQ